jgi:hypothetical protein
LLEEEEDDNSTMLVETSERAPHTGGVAISVKEDMGREE